MLDINSRPSASSTAIALVVAALLGLGMVMVFSASANLGAPPITEHPFKNPSVRQAAFTGAALFIMLMVSLCPYESWRIRPGKKWQPAVALFVVAVVMVGVVLVPAIGEERNGARRWLSIGPARLGLGFQPSEVAKLATVLFLAAVCGHWGPRVRNFWKGFVPLTLCLGAVVGLVGKEDFGTAALILAVGSGILLAAGARLWHLGLMAVLAVPAMTYLVMAKAYRVERLLIFLDPEKDPQGRGYHQIQSLVAIASGEWWGRGLGAGIQKYGYLPESRTDFIFAVICEELGVIGGIAVIGLFAVLAWHGYKAMLRAQCGFGRLLAFGATLTLALQAAINIAVVTVSVPTKGIALPFVSAGGSGVIILGVLAGLLVNVARQRPATQARLNHQADDAGTILTADPATA